MMFQFSTKFEINLHNTAARDIPSVGLFAAKNKVPAVVVNPELIVPTLIDRNTGRYNYKIIVAIDFNNGKNFALDKIKTLSKDIFSADGFDIMLTPGRSEIETGNEMRVLSDFLKTANSLMEIRWVLGLHTRDPQIVTPMLKNMKKFPASYIRTDNNVQVQKAITIEAHKATIETIKKLSQLPIKLSGNVNLALMKELMGIAARFDVSMEQARSIVNAAEIEARAPKKEEKTGAASITEEVDKEILDHLHKLDAGTDTKNALHRVGGPEAQHTYNQAKK